ncbi:APC family permease [Cryobacterium sp. PH31-AA6]|uniref:APC family permease n=1 Tax=Cryobacterium sp. PH31-AA6 TaxID=3046205 RepID=UPI0024B90F67|nr:APC family permease [Cryobacterium sp. PH31-AA6]MDJ0322674.1 APC family permease [Cryobacterium sp. PH31-AA6]
MSKRADKISLTGSISLGTGVMIGAGIFALVGQVAEFAGDWFPLAFLLGAIVAGVSSYSYVRYSSVNPSSGGIAMLLKDAYGSGVVAGSFSLFMYVSMVVAESLLARTFGTYLLRPFGLQDSAILVPVLGVAAIVAAAIVNLIGNKIVEGSATSTAVLKILGIAVLAIAGLIGTAVSGDGLFSKSSGGSLGIAGLLAGTTLCVLAYKGFTTITNQGDDIRDPKKNIARSIIISLLICTILYLLITVSVASSIGADGVVKARDYALAQAAEPLFGAWGVGITVAIAVVATLSGLLASLYSVSRLYEMLQEMKQAPSLPRSISHQPMIITASLGILATAFLDLSQIASMGAFLYLAMDISVQWAVIRHLRSKIQAKSWVPILTIVLDLAILIPFTTLKLQNDLLTVIVAVSVAAAIIIEQTIATRVRTHGE